MKRILSLALAAVILTVSLCISVPATEPAVTSGFYFERVPTVDNSIVFDLYLEDNSEIGLAGVVADITYPSCLELVKSKYMHTDGMCAFSQNLTDYPYRMSALIGTDVFPVGEKVLLARFTFSLKEGETLPDSLNMGIDLDESIDIDGTDRKDEAPAEDYEFVPASEIKSVEVATLPEKTECLHFEEQPDFGTGVLRVNYWDDSVKEVSFAECEISGFDSSVIGENTVTVSYEGYTAEFAVNILPLPGDVNGDGKISLSDVSTVLKYIAAWEVELDEGIADVNNDGAANLTDASVMLKYIAGWDIELV